MKPELKAMILAADDTGEGYITKDPICAVFLAALHWCGDELWCGPFEVGGVWNDDNTEETTVYGLLGTKLPGEWRNEYEARASLMSAAQDQINTWFKE